LSSGEALSGVKLSILIVGRDVPKTFDEVMDPRDAPDGHDARGDIGEHFFAPWTIIMSIIVQLYIARWVIPGSSVSGPVLP
jgi:hypothetical protein